MYNDTSFLYIIGIVKNDLLDSFLRHSKWGKDTCVGDMVMV